MKIIFFCNDLPFFVNHFSTLAKVSYEKGHEVIVLAGGATPASVAALEGSGFRFKALNVSRSGINPFREFAVFLQVYKFIRKEKPDIVQLFTIKPCIYGGIAARLLAVRKVVGTVTGLGYTFTGNTKMAVVRKITLLSLYRFAFGGKKRDVNLVFENLDDKQFFEKQKVIAPANTSRVWGAGVDLKRFSEKQNSPYAQGASKILTVILPSRMLRDKGVLEFIGAANELKHDGIEVDMVLVGGVDSANPASLKESEIRLWVDKNVVSWLGHRSDMPEQLQRADIVCLPSYREGMPKVLLEAMSCGKAIITTDAPGCREVIESGIHGLIVPVADHMQLKQAILKLVKNPALVLSMGRASRRRAELMFADTMIADNYIALYETVARPGND